MYETCKWRGNSLLFQNVRFVTEGKQSPLDIQVEDLQVTLCFQWSSLKVTPKVLLIRPKMVWKEKKKLYEGPIEKVSHTLDEWFCQNFLDLTEGKFVIENEVALVSLSHPKGKEKGCFNIGKQGKLPALKGAFWKENDRLKLELSFSEFDMEWAFKIGGFFFPKIHQTFFVNRGNLNGTCAFSFPFNRPIDSLKCALDLKEFALREKRSGTFLEIDHLEWKESFDLEKEEERKEISSFLKPIWRSSMSEAAVSGVHLTIEDSFLNQSWTFKDIQGTVQLSPFDFPLIQFSGFYEAKGKREERFSLVGKERETKEKGWGIVWETEGVADNGSQATVSLTAREKKPLLVEMGCLHLTPDLLGLLKHFAKRSFPFLDKVRVDRGAFSANAHGLIEGGRWSYVDVENWSASNVGLHFPDENIGFEAEAMSGKGGVDFLVPALFHKACWKLSLLEGVIFFSGERQLEKIALALSMERPSMRSSFIKEGSTDGAFSHLSGRLEACVSSNRFSHFLKAGDLEIPSHFALDLNLTLETLKESLMIAGSLGELSEKEKRETFHFSSHWDLEALKKGQIRQGLQWGEFKGEKVSDRFVNLALIFSNQDYRLKGDLCIQGCWDSHQIEVIVDPTYIAYHSKYFDLYPQCKKEEKAPQWIFSYQYEQKSWSGKIPLKDVGLKEHSLGIEFESFTSDGYLEKNKYFFQNVDAIAYRIRFKGEVSVDFSSKKWGDLVIRTHEIEARAQEAMAFLNRFNRFKKMTFPLQGKISSPAGGLFLHAHIGKEEKLLDWDMTLCLKEGKGALSSTIECENVSGSLYYSVNRKRCVIEKIGGTCVLSGGPIPRFYTFNVPLIEWDAKGGWIYDCRLDDSIHEVCRFSGRGTQVGDELILTFDPGHPRLYGAEMDVKVLKLKGWRLNGLQIETSLSALDIVHYLDFLSSVGMFPIKSETLREMRGAQMQGSVSFKVDYDASQHFFSFNVYGDRLSMGSIAWDHLAIHGQRKEDVFRLDRFEVGSLRLLAQMEKGEGLWQIPCLEIHWKENFLKGKGGLFNEQEKQLTFSVEEVRIELDEIKDFFSSSHLDRESISGIAFAKGDIVLDFASGLQNWFFDSHLKWIVEEFGPGKLRFEGVERANLSYHPSFGFSVGESRFNILHPKYHEIWAKCQIDGIDYHEKTLSIKQMRVVIPPEMLSFLGQTRLFPHLKYEEERLIVCGYPIKWENQIEAILDFSLGKKNEVKGVLKEGYYWIGSKAWYFNHFLFDIKNETLSFSADIACNKESFEISGAMAFLDPFFKGRFEVREIGQAKSKEPFSSLMIATDWHPNEGFFIQTIEGAICGMDVSFHHNPKRSARDKMALTGQLKINFARLSLFLPEEIKRMIQRFGIGNGYELSGDLIISKTSFEKSAFLGYLKGKHFECMGSIMETLLSEIQIYPDHITLSRFSMSDAAGIFSIHSIEIARERECEWELRIPQLVITDFRPSLLKKIGKCPTRIKPLTIRNLYCHTIQGTLGKKESFTGKGELHFINTFKRDAHILDIPFEILGRLGLDMGLLVPVRGRLEFALLDGRIYLNHLKESYSEGKRSQFFFSPVEPSYIDLQGHLNVHIKMKQFVLIKVTEPFTLHIGGSFEHPKYSLR